MGGGDYLFWGFCALCVLTPVSIYYFLIVPLFQLENAEQIDDLFIDEYDYLYNGTLINIDCNDRYSKFQDLKIAQFIETTEDLSIASIVLFVIMVVSLCVVIPLAIRDGCGYMGKIGWSFAVTAGLCLTGLLFMLYFGGFDLVIQYNEILRLVNKHCDKSSDIYNEMNDLNDESYAPINVSIVVMCVGVCICGACGMLLARCK